MARPKANAPGPNAKERIRDAFWSMLSEMDYSQITVNRLSSRAGVNHNTFYYHFKKLDDYALEAAGGEAARSFAETQITCV